MIQAPRDFGEEEEDSNAEAELFGPEEAVYGREVDNEEEDEDEERRCERVISSNDTPCWSPSSSRDDDDPHDGAGAGAYTSGALLDNEGHSDHNNHQQADDEEDEDEGKHHDIAMDDVDIHEREDAYDADIDRLQNWMDEVSASEAREFQQDQAEDFGEVAEDLKDVLRQVRFSMELDMKEFAAAVTNVAKESAKNKRAKMSKQWLDRFMRAESQQKEDYCFSGELGNGKSGYVVKCNSKAGCPCHKQGGDFCISMRKLVEEEMLWEVAERA